MADLRLHIGDEEPLLLSNAEFFPSSGLFCWQNQDAFKSGNTPFSNGATLKVRIIEFDPILTITAVKRPVRFLKYEEVGVRPALVDFQVSRTGLWLNAMPFPTHGGHRCDPGEVSQFQGATGEQHQRLALAVKLVPDSLLPQFSQWHLHPLGGCTALIASFRMNGVYVPLPSSSTEADSGLPCLWL